MNAHGERLSPLVELVDVNMVMVNFCVTRNGVVLMFDWFSDHGRRANERPDADHSTMDMFTRLGLSGLDGGQTKSSPEGVGHLNEFVFGMLATRTTGDCLIVKLRGKVQLGYGTVREGMTEAEVGGGGDIVGTGYDDHAQGAGGNLTWKP